MFGQVSYLNSLSLYDSMYKGRFAFKRIVLECAANPFLIFIKEPDLSFLLVMVYSYQRWLLSNIDRNLKCFNGFSVQSMDNFLFPEMDLSLSDQLVCLGFLLITTHLNNSIAYIIFIYRFLLGSIDSHHRCLNVPVIFYLKSWLHIATTCEC